MAKTHISIIGTRGIPGNYGGFETFASELAPRLVEAGYEVTVFGKSKVGEKKKYKGVNVWNIPCADGGFNDIKYDTKCYKLSCEFADIIYICGYGGTPFMKKSLSKHKPVFVNVDGIEYKRGKWKKPIQWYFRLCERSACRKFNVIADNEGIKEYIDRRHKTDSLFIPYGAYIYNDDATEYLDKHGYKKNGYYLIVARMEPENNIRLMVGGFKSSKTPKKLIIVGNLHNKEYIDSLGIQDDVRIIFHGPEYDQPNLRQLRYNAYAYMHGHEVGGTNPSLLEAMGCGNVVLAVDVPFNRYVLGENGFYFDKSIKSVVDLVDKADNMDIDYVNKLKQSIVSMVDTRYNWEMITKNYILLFEKEHK